MNVEANVENRDASRKFSSETRGASGPESDQRARAAGERVRLDAQTLQHTHEEIRERDVVRGIESEIFPVLEATAREQQRQISGRVRIRVAEATALENLRAIE